VRYLLTFILCVAPLTAAPINKGERQRLVAHFEMTESWLADEVAGLSPAQMQFRPGEGAWLVTEIVEHLSMGSGFVKAAREWLQSGTPG
jgi:hypothetical protein